MFKKLTIAAVAAATLAGSAPALAFDHDRGNHYGRGYNSGYGYDRGYRGYDNGYRGYNNYRGYNGYRDYSYRRCSDGATGTIVGAIAGGLLGSSVAGRHGDKTAGVLIGGVAGALAGRAIDKNGNGCR